MGHAVETLGSFGAASIHSGGKVAERERESKSSEEPERKERFCCAEEESRTGYFQNILESLTRFNLRLLSPKKSYLFYNLHWSENSYLAFLHHWKIPKIISRICNSIDSKAKVETHYDII